MKIKISLWAILISITSITYAQTNPQKIDEPAIVLMSEAPAQIRVEATVKYILMALLKTAIFNLVFATPLFFSFYG